MIPDSNVRPVTAMTQPLDRAVFMIAPAPYYPFKMAATLRNQPALANCVIEDEAPKTTQVSQ